ncbi:hypothetical protein EGW08_023145 [Elysia chlorotica]|uniref:Uncharacterized protein n=1 Tax=Elysia chlorotica TaxID=188477 RepID=A0A3S1AQF6_ELYCH|nr:hypothetical protein EGW08_023145 [Elysia chlorotica]
MTTKNISRRPCTFEMADAGDDTLSELSKTPSVFTLNVTENVTESRLKAVKDSIAEEVNILEKIQEPHEDDVTEMIQAYDLLTWLEFKVGCEDKAEEFNKKALALAGEENRAAFSLGNRAHLMWSQGDVDQTMVCLSRLAPLRQGGAQEQCTAAIQGGQAYCLLRLGGLSNLLNSLTLYEKALSTKPQSCLWVLQAGRVYKRLAHPNFLKKGEKIDKELKAKREQNARICFQNVSQQSSNPRLKAMAFSDLANMGSISRLPRRDIQHLCDEALKHDCQSPYVLLHCGKSLVWIDISKAKGLLEEASNLRPSSHVSFELGRCFFSMSKKYPCRAEYYQNEAEKSYRESVRLAPNNMPARYSLAVLLWDIGRIEEARKECMRIIATVKAQDQCYAQTLMKAYEKAAICQLELCQDKEFVANLTPPISVSSLKEGAENMLLIALEMGYNLLSQREIEIYLRPSLVSLAHISFDKKDTSSALQMISTVFHYAKQPRYSLQALDKLLDHVSDAPKDIIYVLKSYHDLRSYEKAYALLQMYTTRLGPSVISHDLHQQLALSAAYARLRFDSRHAAQIFKSLFYLCKQTRDSLRAGQTHGKPSPSSGALPQPKPSDTSASDQALDVLILHDEPRDPSALGLIFRELQQAIISVFGLNVSRNLKGCYEPGQKQKLLFKEITKAEVVLVLLGPDPMRPYFEGVLDFLPGFMEKSEDNPVPPRILIACTNDSVEVQSPVSVFPKTPFIAPVVASLKAVEQRCQDNDEALGVTSDMSEDRVSAIVGDVLSFFCCLTSIDWQPPSDMTH